MPPIKSTSMPVLMGLCQYFNAAVLVLIALFFFLIPGVVVHHAPVGSEHPFRRHPPILRGKYTGIYRLNSSDGPGYASVPGARLNFPPAIFQEPNGLCSERFFISGRQRRSRMNGREAMLPVPARRKFTPAVPSKPRHAWSSIPHKRTGLNCIGVKIT